MKCGEKCSDFSIRVYRSLATFLSQSALFAKNSLANNNVN